MALTHLHNRRILVTGGSGFLGTCLQEHLVSQGCRHLSAPSSEEYDLREVGDIRAMLTRIQPEVVIHLAAVVGGIGANRENPGRYFYENAIMGIQLIEECRRQAVEKFVGVATICCYPKHTPVPFREEDLWNGYPEETNAPYGLAKKMLLVQAQAYRQQYGLNAITLLPVNLYGPGDNFDPRTSHVIPALIRKVIEARDAGRDRVEVWGTGNASREFLFVRDAAHGIALAANRYDQPEPVNIGSGREITIKNLAVMICDLCGFEGNIRWDASKPDGQPRRCLDTTRAREQFGFEAETSFRDGLIETIAWYERNRDSLEKKQDDQKDVRQSSNGNGQDRRTTTSLPAARFRQVAEMASALDTPHQGNGNGDGQSPRRALITGVTGQDGSYLAELLLNKGYEVHGIVRRSSTILRPRIDPIGRSSSDTTLTLHYGDVTDAANMIRLVLDIEPDEIYNLAAQSHVRVSFDKPVYTMETAATGALNMLEAARLLHRHKAVRFYQASSSEMFGGAPGTAPQNESTPFHPRSPYACAKTFAHHQAVNYREAHGLFACCGILFNHESPRRGESFVTRKITIAAGRIREGLQEKLYLGNLDARRDWGFAGDYVEAMWRMLQEEEPDDFVIATGETHTVREFLELAFGHVGLDWQEYASIDPRFFRPAEVHLLHGDASKARERLGWEPATSFEDLVPLLVEADWRLAKEEAVMARHREALV